MVCISFFISYLYFCQNVWCITTRNWHFATDVLLKPFELFQYNGYITLSYISVNSTDTFTALYYALPCATWSSMKSFQNWWSRIIFMEQKPFTERKRCPRVRETESLLKFFTAVIKSNQEYPRLHLHLRLLLLYYKACFNTIPPPNCFQGRSQNFKTRLLASSRLSVCTSVRNYKKYCRISVKTLKLWSPNHFNWKEIKY
jgi:hypothetical protein